MAGGLLLVPIAFGDSAGTGAAVAAATGALIMVAAPAFVGATVCGLGKLSRHYTGRCTAAILSAYAGQALATGLLLVGGQSFGEDVAFVGVVATLLLPPLAAVVGWNLFKQPLPYAEVSGTTKRLVLPPPRRSGLRATVVPVFLQRF